MTDKPDEIDEWIWETFTNTWMRDENGDFVAVDDKYGVFHDSIKQAILALKSKWETEAYKKGYITGGIDELERVIQITNQKGAMSIRGRINQLTNGDK